MHYIIGTTFCFTKQRPIIGQTSSAVKRPTKPKEFEYNKTYTLYNIKRSPGIVENETLTYVFTGSDNTFIEKEFDTIAEADVTISRWKGEHLPNYSAVYARNQT